MRGPYERALTGADVCACARHAGLEDSVLDRLEALMSGGDVVVDLDDLAVRAGADALGLPRSRWVATFGPLFGEFE